MGRLAGQAARLAGRAALAAAQAALSLAVALAVVLGALAWRLDQGAIDAPWLAQRIDTEAHARGVALQVGGASLEWGAWRSGPAAPLRLSLSGLHGPVGGGRETEPTLAARRVEASFAVLPLLAGRIVPEEVTMEGVRARLVRNADGSVALGNEPSADATSARQPPPANQGALAALRQIQRLHLHDIAITVYDSQIGLAWQVARADADFDRDQAGGIAGHGTIQVEAAGRSATITLTAQQAAGGGVSTVQASLTPLVPAELAGLAPAFAPLAALDATVTLQGQASLGPDLALRTLHAEAAVGAGTIHAGDGTAPVLSASLTLDGSPDRLRAALRLETAPSPDGPRTVVTAASDAIRSGGGWRASTEMDVNRVAFGDFQTLWPKGVGGPGTRPWITKNIPSGELAGGRLDLVLDVPADLSDVALASIHGGIDGHDLEVHWLRPVPPIVHADGRLTIDDPDVIDIAVNSGTQSGGQHGGIAFSGGRVHLTGIAASDQFADIETDLSGPLPDLLAVLNNPRVKLLSKRPIPMRDPAGQLHAHLKVAHLPLRDDVSLDDLAISTTAHLTGVHLGGIAAGRDLDRGVLDLSADNDGLKVGGRADLAGIPARLSVAMDFRAGPPTQVDQEVSVSATVSDRELAARGVNTYGLLRGKADIEASLRTQRGGQGEVQASADLTRASLAAPQLGFAKPEGEPTRASIHVGLDHDRLASIDQLRVEGPQIDVRGSADIAGGQPRLLRMERIRLGSGTDAHGTVRLPAAAGMPYVVDIAGPSLDAGPAFEQQTARQPAKAPTAAPPGGKPGGNSGPAFIVDARFAKVLLGEGRRIDAFAAHADNDGRIIRRADLSGVVRSRGEPTGAPGSPFRMAIVPEGNGRHATAEAPDLGGLLRTLDFADNIEGGELSLDARYDDRSPTHPLSGRAEVRRFRVLDAPLVGRILKAATLYGIIDLLRGPGLGFTRLVAPFRYEADVLRLSDARVVSPSLGGTAKGTVDFATRKLDLQGTIVPAYALNALPGRIPLIGRLFSPERGGGLFAATYTVRGAFDHPNVGINPLAALTPGFLRGLFDWFDGPQPARK